MNMMEIISKLLLKNRTIVSSDFDQCIETLAAELPFEIHRYPSGSEFGTWNVPPKWDVTKATLSDGENIVASFYDHPLFLAPYSHSFTGWLDKEELLTHVRSSEEMPDAYLYEHRLAGNYQRRLNEWLISLPHSKVQQLNKPRYFVDIEVKTEPGNLLVAEHTIKGKHEQTFAILTHLCHPGQANDGLAGVAVGMEVMKRLAKEFTETNYSYQLLVMPETFGSSVFLAANEGRIESYLGSVFIEMPGIDSPITLKATRTGTTYLDRVLKYVTKDLGLEYSECGFREQWGNDELVFDSPGVGIPGAAILRYPFHYYHTSGDDLKATNPDRLEEIVQILLATINLIDSDFIPAPRNRVPVYLTRYNLYADAVTERESYAQNSAVLDSLWNGSSIFDIAQTIGAPYTEVKEFVGKLAQNDLVEKMPITPKYFRHGAL